MQDGSPWDRIAISEFKAKCFRLLNQVQKTKKPIRVTRFGKPIAEGALSVERCRGTCPCRRDNLCNLLVEFFFRDFTPEPSEALLSAEQVLM